MSSRNLRFIVDGETIKQDPSCDFSGLFPGKNPYICAEFDFSPEWDNRIKVASFASILGKEYDPQLIEDDACMIPAEALARPVFKMQILGRHKNHNYKTNTINIYQRGASK